MQPMAARIDCAAYPAGVQLNSGGIGCATPTSTWSPAELVLPPVSWHMTQGFRQLLTKGVEHCHVAYAIHHQPCLPEAVLAAGVDGDQHSQGSANASASKHSHSNLQPQEPAPMLRHGVVPTAVLCCMVSSDEQDSVLAAQVAAHAPCADHHGITHYAGCGIGSFSRLLWPSFSTFCMQDTHDT